MLSMHMVSEPVPRLRSIAVTGVTQQGGSSNAEDRRAAWFRLLAVAAGGGGEGIDMCTGTGEQLQPAYGQEHSPVVCRVVSCR